MFRLRVNVVNGVCRIGIDDVEPAHQLEILDAPASSEPSGQFVGKIGQYSFAVAGATLAALLLLDDLAADLVVCVDLGDVRDGGDAATGVFDERDDAVGEGASAAARCGFCCGAGVHGRAGRLRVERKSEALGVCGGL